jgi:hypothetical protein
MNMRKSIPCWLALCLMVFSVSVAVAFATSVTSIPFTKPWTTSMTFTSTQLQVNSATFGGYNAVSNTYASCTVTVQNYYTSGSATPIVQVGLFDSTNTVIASGSTTSTALAAGSSANIVVNLTWTSGKSLNDVVSGTIVVTQS